MNKMIKLGLASLLGATLSVAYEVNGPLELVYTGYKTMKKVGVNGTFKDVKFISKKNDNFVDFLKSMNVDIDALSLDTKLKMRNDNISVLFKNAKSTNITAKIADAQGDDKAGKMVIDITMNNVSKKSDFTYQAENGQIIAKGNIDILDFAMNKSFADFAKKCKGLHAGKSWSDVGLKFVVPYKK